MCSKYHLIKLESQSPDRKEDKIESLSSIAHAVHTTTKQLISCRRKDENGYVINGYVMLKKWKTHAQSVQNSCLLLLNMQMYDILVSVLVLLA